MRRAVRQRIPPRLRSIISLNPRAGKQASLVPGGTGPDPARQEAQGLRAQGLEARALERARVDQHRARLGVRTEKGGEIHGLAERTELLLTVGADVTHRDLTEAQARAEADGDCRPPRRLPV